ncbi:MAG: NAD(P) transhydrogenase subunit alpha [Spirochaetes bacterium]|nr:NAD(P) transhydrogenase subunit alpha [Spirochaetota bacterium]
MCIGVPKEIMTGENRVAATPETVKKLVADGAKVLVQEGAGVGAFFEDEEYRTAGAVIESDVEKLFKSADIVMKVKEPMQNEALAKHELDLMREGQLLVTFIHPANPINHKMVQDMAKKGVISLSLDSIPRISRAQSMDALTSMSTVAGYKSVISASTMLPKFIPMVGTAVGMIQPAKIFVVGAGVAGLQALATAKRLGAVTYAADVRPDAVEQAKSLGAKIVETGIPPAEAVGKGGYARHLPDDLLLKERESFKDIIREVDVVILSALVPGRLAPIILTEQMVKSMQHGSIIEDISIDQGGNCELTVSGKVVKKYDVTINGTKNIPGSVPVTATHMFAKNILNFVSILVKDGKINIDLNDEIIKSALVTHEGKLVHEGALEAIRGGNGK